MIFSMGLHFLSYVWKQTSLWNCLKPLVFENKEDMYKDSLQDVFGKLVIGKFVCNHYLMHISDTKA